jgi:transposase
MVRVAVGVDVGKTSHQVAVYEPGTDRVVGQLRFAVSRAGFERFRAFLARIAPDPAAVVVGVEASGHYHLTVADFLAEAGYAAVLVNPYRATQFRRSQGTRAKTDRLDARALARFVAGGAGSSLPAADERLAGLRELTRFRAELVRDRTTALNRLHGALDVAFPEFPRLVHTIHCPTALALLRAYPTAPALAAADPDAVRRLVCQVSRGSLGDNWVAALLAAARTSVAARRRAPALAAKVGALVRQVTALDAEIAELEATIAREFAALGLRPADFPAGGPVALATLLAEAGDVHRSPSVKRFLAHFGWCPADTQSGAYRDSHPRLTRAGNRYVRRLIWMLAVHSVSRPGPYQDYFRRRTAAGKNKMDSLVAVGRKLLATTYAILKSGRPYDPAYRSPGHTTVAAAA